MAGASVKFLLDSVILIDHFNDVPQATQYLARTHNDAVISVITRAEVLSGFDALGSTAARRLLDCFPTLPIDKTVADLAARLRRETRWRLPDAFQAALAQMNGLRLVTRNSKDFPPQKWPFVLIPYKVK
ncbi:MAG: PIN domain-containing protein [Acidobacteria bacterium]|nr:PIN domain-containing protein [Acidobacteriota bacterium]